MAQDNITLCSLTKRYKGFHAVDHVDLTIHQGEVFGFLGPNGSGKTTTFLMILGFTQITAGSISVFGMDPTRNTMEVKQMVAYLPDTLGFYSHMTVLDNLIYTGSLLGMCKADAQRLAMENLALTALSQAACLKVSQLSRGMRQRLGISDMLMKKPRVFILDEPTLGLDPQGAEELLSLIQTLSAAYGMTVLISSHQMEHLQKICDRVAVFKAGKLIKTGTFDELLSELNRRGEELSEIKLQHLSDSERAQVQAVEGVVYVQKDGSSVILGVKREQVSAVLKAILAAGYTIQRVEEKGVSLTDLYRYYFDQ